MAGIERYSTPETLEEAVRSLAQGPVTVLAGGTDLMPQTRAGMRDFEPSLVNIKDIPELKGIDATDGLVRIGALATVAEVRGSALLKERAGVLPEAADRFASCQVRHAATIGGNIMNASPAGDMIIPLLLLDAEVELASWTGEEVSRRRSALCEFFAGPGKTKHKAGELLVSISFKLPGKDHVSAFRKFGTRPALDISVVSVGVAGRRENGCLRGARVAFGAVAPTPLRGRKTEAAVDGKDLTPENISRAARIAREEVSPISDVRASEWYRRELIQVFTERLLKDVAQV